MKAIVVPQCLLLLLFYSLSFGGNDLEQVSPPFRSEGDGPSFCLDYANFRGVQEFTYVEFYFQVGYRALQFIKHDEGFQADYTLDFQIRDTNGNLIESFQNNDTFEVVTFEATESVDKARVMMISVSLTSGRYQLMAMIRDHETRHVSQVEHWIEVIDFRSSNLQVSDIQFSQKIEKATDGPFVKNMRYIEPNAHRAFSEERADIYLYFEIYNLTYFDDRDNYFYTCDFLINDADGVKVRKFEQTKRIPGLSSAHSIRVPAGLFSSGTYTLHITVTDQATGKRAETSQTFTVIKESMILVDSHDIF